jgi:hypothetical protein
MHRLFVSLVLAALIIAFNATPAAAGGGAGAYTDPGPSPSPGSGAAGGAYTDGGGAGANASNSDTSSSGGGGGSSNPCHYEVLPPDEAAGAERYWGPNPGGAGAWYRTICADGSGRTTATIVWLANAVDPAAMAADAAKYLPFPSPSISTSPSTNEMLVVNFATWLWVDSAAWQPLTTTAAVPGVAVTVTATPERVTWLMGDGGSVVCNGPGNAYNSAVPDDQQSTYCSYSYPRTSASEQSGRFSITATVDWHVTWTIAGALGGGDLGIVPRSSGPVPVRVGEVQGINDSSNQG